MDVRSKHCGQQFQVAEMTRDTKNVHIQQFKTIAAVNISLSCPDPQGNVYTSFRQTSGANE